MVHSSYLEPFLLVGIPLELAERLIWRQVAERPQGDSRPVGPTRTTERWPPPAQASPPAKPAPARGDGEGIGRVVQGGGPGVTFAAGALFQISLPIWLISLLTFRQCFVT
ncbi:MAG TPA: hypothetical protein VJA25_09730 [Dehalococcoidia bacterium]|nr:hypothetical protein [Dehalococcoidia bacterium]